MLQEKNTNFMIVTAENCLNKKKNIAAGNYVIILDHIRSSNHIGDIWREAFSAH